MPSSRRATLPSLVIFASRVIFVAEDSIRVPQKRGIVFVGSSIFRFWTHLTEQMAPLPILNRAIAGMETQDMLNSIDRLALAYKPRIVVYYCGSNDISTGDTAGPIIERTKRFVQILQEKSPGTCFYYTAIQKAPEKQDRWNVVDAVNAEMKRFSAEAKNVGFIDLNPVLFDIQGRLRGELFLPDCLHFRPDGPAYPEFARIVKPVLTKAWESGAGITH
jgi:lysophospholipase L1-like esterase